MKLPDSVFAIDLFVLDEVDDVIVGNNFFIVIVANLAGVSAKSLS